MSSIKKEENEIERVVTILLDNLALTVSSQTGRLGADLRRQIGDVRANYIDMLVDGTFTAELFDCFVQVRGANVKLLSVANIRTHLIFEESNSEIATAIIQAGISFCLATESRMVTEITFVSRDDVDAMMKKMKLAFDQARDKAADDIDSSTYRELTYLASGLTNHLATVARPLPRMVKFNLARNLPALALSMRLYYVADRGEQLVAENHTVHPAFMQRQISGLNR